MTKRVGSFVTSPGFEFIGDGSPTLSIELEIYKCDCGFYLGVDGSYLEQVDNVEVDCPSCGEIISTMIDCGDGQRGL